MSAITIERMADADEPMVRRLKIREVQSDFVDSIDHIIDTRGEGEDFFTVKHEGIVIGFFAIRRAIPGQYDGFCKGGELIWGSFVMAQSRVGKRFGREACIIGPGVLKMEYPDSSRIVFTVNHRNVVAQNTHIKAGFVNANVIYLGGGYGPQQVYFLDM